MTIVLGLTILSVANYGNTYEFSGLKPTIKPFSAPTNQVNKTLIIFCTQVLTIVNFNSIIKETNSSQRSDSIVYPQSPSEHHSTTLNNRINLTNHTGQIINHLDLILVTRDLLYTPATVVIKDQRLTVLMNTTISHLDSNHSQHRHSQSSINTSLDHRKNSIKISRDLPISIKLANTSKNTNLEHITDLNFLLPLFLQNTALNNLGPRIRY